MVSAQNLKKQSIQYAFKGVNDLEGWAIAICKENGGKEANVTALWRLVIARALSDGSKGLGVFYAARWLHSHKNLVKPPDKY